MFLETKSRETSNILENKTVSWDQTLKCITFNFTLRSDSVDPEREEDDLIRNKIISIH